MTGGIGSIRPAPGRARGRGSKLAAELTVCEQIGHWASGLRRDALPGVVVERAQLQRDSMLAAAAAGARAAQRFEAAASDGPLGELHRNAVASMAHDWDDYLFMGHTGHSAVWAARAFAGDGGDALPAQVAGNEVAGRLGAALFLGPHNGQFWSSIHCAGGAAATAVALGLGPDQTAHSLAIALYQPPYGVWPGFMGPDSKLLTAADPAVQGARAALLAAEGVEGALDVLEHPRGVLRSFSFAPLPGMLGGLGRVWLTDTLAFKPWPGCAYLQAAVEAALRGEVAAADVASIEVDAGLLTCSMEELGRGQRLTPIRVTFSTALSVAVALIAGRLTHEELDPAWLRANEEPIRALAARVSIRHDPELTLATLAGSTDAGVGLGSLGGRDWLRVRRRSRELGIDGLSPGARELARFARTGAGRRALRGYLRRARGARAEIEALDTSKVRLTFPCRLRIRLRSGRTLELEGDEPGSCGRPLSEQRAVVEAKLRLTGAAGDLSRPRSRTRPGRRSSTTSSRPAPSS